MEISRFTFSFFFLLALYFFPSIILFFFFSNIFSSFLGGFFLFFFLFLFFSLQHFRLVQCEGFNTNATFSPQNEKLTLFKVIKL